MNIFKEQKIASKSKQKAVANKPRQKNSIKTIIMQPRFSKEIQILY